MLKNYKVKLFAALLMISVSVGNVNALNPDTPLTTTANNSENWEIVQNQKGINIYFLEVQKGNESYLKIKFENTTNKTVNFLWSLNKKGEIVINESNNKINALSMVNDNNLLIPYNNGDTYADFTFNLKIK